MRPSRRIVHGCVAAALCSQLVGVASAALAYDPLDFVPQQLPAARLSGSADMRRYGKPLYAAKLFVDPGRFSPKELTRQGFALDFEYQKAYKGAHLIRDIDTQMEDTGVASRAQIRGWQPRLQAMLPDLTTHDHLTVVFWPGRGTGFFRNGKPIGEIAGDDFARAFFGIWLDEGTTMPDIRQALLHGAG